MAIVVRDITMQKAIQQKSHESMYKMIKIKDKAKRLRATTFAIAKFEEQ